MLNEELKRCVDCKFYPTNCGYWGKDFREKNPNLGFIKKDTNHNCQDFSPFEFHTKEEWDFILNR